MSEYLIAFPSFFCTFIAIALGLFVWSRNFQSTSHRLFAMGMAALALMALGNSLVLLSSTLPAFIFWQRISLVGKVLMPITWLTFVLTFAHADFKLILIKRRILLIALLLASLVFLLFVASDAFFYPGSDMDTSSPLLRLGPVGRWFYIYLLLSSVLILAQLENTFRSASESQRWQIKFLIIGIGTIFAFSIYTSSQTLLFSTIFTQLIPMEAILILISLGMMAFSLVRHRNLEVDLFVSRHVVYGSVIFIASGIYLFAVGLLARILSSFGNRINPFLAPLIILLLISGLVIFLSSSMVSRRLRLFISQHFYKHKYDFHLKWLEATERLGSRQTMSDLISALTDFIKETLGATEVFVWLYNKERGQFLNGGLRLTAGHDLVSYITGHISPVAIRDLPPTISSGFSEHGSGDMVDQPLASTLYPLSSVLTPLIANDIVIGFIIIGPDITGNEYVQNDYDLLRAVGKQIAHQILNINLMDDLSNSKKLEGFHEMSVFVVHEIKNLSMTLSLMIPNVETHFDKPEFRRDALKTLNQIVVKLNDFTSRLSGFSRIFNLEKAKVDINRLIAGTITTLDGVINANMTQQLEPLLPLLEIDQTQIKEVLINLLMNAHNAVGQEGTIRISTLLHDGSVILSVSDNGGGMTEDFIKDKLFKPFKTTKPQGLGIGLFHSKKIIEAHGGSIDVQSEKGKGTTFQVCLPVKSVR